MKEINRRSSERPAEGGTESVAREPRGIQGAEPLHKDEIDFAHEPVRGLFGKMLWPTLLGMLSMVVLNLSDGAFVGHGAGSDALAAINIAAPIFNIMTGIGIMFGIGSSIIASVHLSHGNVKAARINATQALLGSFVMALFFSVLILSNLAGTCRLFGSNDELIPLASSYLRWIAAFMPLQMLGMVGEFVVRLDGSPKFAMSCTLVASILNIILDYVFIFPLHMGLEGAAIATTLSFACSAVIVVIYVLCFAKTLKIYRLRATWKSFLLTLRNLAYQMRAGFSAMLGEIAVSGAIIVGNYVFIARLGQDGVAAYSVVCYCMPIIFMMANAVVQSAQPIASFAYGAGDGQRLAQARRVSLESGAIVGLISSAFMIMGSRLIAGLFLSPNDAAYELCLNGLPLFGVGSLFIALNLVLIGYLQSIERSAAATVFMLLRGFVIVIPTFLLLPQLLGTAGMWLAIPASELATLLLLAAYASFSR